MPPSHEVRGWSRLLAGVADRVVAGTVHGMHHAISAGAYRWVGPVGRPVQTVDRAVTDRVYGVVRAGLRGAGEMGAALAGHLGGDAAEPSPVAVKARAIAHGVVGEDLMALAPELDLDVSLRDAGREVAVEAEELRRTYPDAGGRVAVFVHGLADTEAAWFGRPGDADAGDVAGAGEAAAAVLPDVAAEAGVTPLMIRYGTGRAIGRNGRDLAELLEVLVAAWPVPVTELVVVGHSMGGLLMRAACTAGQDAGHGWPETLTDIVYLGSPHLGSWLEKVTNLGSWALRRSSRSAPLGGLLDGRSRGIKDLRFGTLAEDGWGETPLDDLLSGLVADEPWSEEVTHHLVVGRLRPDERHPLNVVFGDALVRTGSAAGAGRRRRIASGGQVVVVPVPARHSRLVQHPHAEALLRGVLDREPVSAAG